MGDVAGLYSDLLLHDMGPSLGDTGRTAADSPTRPSGGPCAANSSRPTARCRSAPPPARSGGPRRCGEFAIPARIFTTVERPRSSRRSPFTGAKGEHQRKTFASLEPNEKVDGHDVSEIPRRSDHPMARRDAAREIFGGVFDLASSTDPSETGHAGPLQLPELR